MQSAGWGPNDELSRRRERAGVHLNAAHEGFDLPSIFAGLRGHSLTGMMDDFR
jgi:hypothetical protein